MAQTIVLTKTVGTALLAHTQQATATMTIGSTISVTTKLACQLMLKMGRTVATALTNEVKFRAEGSAKSSGNDEWYTILEWTSQYGKTAAISTTLNGATTAGNATSVLASGTSIVAGSHLYYRETGTPANSEWSRVKSISTNTVTHEDPQTRDHTNSIAVTSLAETFLWVVDLSSVTRLRLIVDSASAASGQTVDVIAWLNTLDSLDS